MNGASADAHGVGKGLHLRGKALCRALCIGTPGAGLLFHGRPEERSPLVDNLVP